MKNKLTLKQLQKELEILKAKSVKDNKVERVLNQGRR
jgi:hypothetical protein